MRKGSAKAACKVCLLAHRAAFPVVAVRGNHYRKEWPVYLKVVLLNSVGGLISRENSGTAEDTLLKQMVLCWRLEVLVVDFLSAGDHLVAVAAHWLTAVASVNTSLLQAQL